MHSHDIRSYLIGAAWLAVCGLILLFGLVNVPYALGYALGWVFADITRGAVFTVAVVVGASAVLIRIAVGIYDATPERRRELREGVGAIFGLAGFLVVMGGILWLLIMAETAMWPSR